MKTLETVAMWLVVIGGLNWLLVGLFNYDLVAGLFGEGSALSRLVYVLVGLAAVYVLWMLAMRMGRRDTVVA